MPAVRTTRSTSQVSDTGENSWHGHGRNRWEPYRTGPAEDQQLGSGPGPEGGGQQINISTGKRLEETGEAEMWHSADSADNGEFFQTTVGEFCRGVLSTSRTILWNISIADCQCRRRLRILDAGEEEAVPEDAAVMGDW